MKKLRVLSIIFIITLLSSISAFADTTEMPSLNKDIPSVEIPQTTRIDGYYFGKLFKRAECRMSMALGDMVHPDMERVQ